MNAFVTPANLLIVIFYREEELLGECYELLSRRWGLPDYESATLAISTPQAFQQEMGSPLFKKLVSFPELKDPSEIISIKKNCLLLEEKFSEREQRRINLDVWSLESSKLIYYSRKPLPHRLYHSQGVYLDLQLLFLKEKMQLLPWSFPEVKNHFYEEDILKVRSLYLEKLKTFKQARHLPSFPQLLK